MSHSLHGVIPLNRSIYLCFIKGVILQFSRFRSHINYTASAKTGHFWFSFLGRCEFGDLYFEFENIKHALGSRFHGSLCLCSWSAEKSHICQPICGEEKGRKLCAPPGPCSVNCYNYEKQTKPERSQVGQTPVSQGSRTMWRYFSSPFAKLASIYFYLLIAAFVCDKFIDTNSNER